MFCIHIVAKADNSTTNAFKLIDSTDINDKKKINKIKDDIIIIDKTNKRYQKMAKKILGHSSEGGIIIFYYDKKIAKKIVFNVCGEMGRCIDKYYLNDNQTLMAIKSEDIDYDRPFYIKGFEIKLKELRTYYFIDEIPVYIVDKNSPNFTKDTDQLIKYLEEHIYPLHEIIEMFNNPEAEILPNEEIPAELLQND